MALTVWSQAAVHQKPRATILKVVTLLFEGGNSFICRTNAVNFMADVLRVLPGEKFCAALRIEFARHENRNFPFVFGFRQVWAAGNLRAEDDAALGAGLSAAAVLFIAGTRWQE